MSAHDNLVVDMAVACLRIVFLLLDGANILFHPDSQSRPNFRILYILFLVRWNSKKETHKNLQIYPFSFI